MFAMYIDQFHSRNPINVSLRFIQAAFTQLFIEMCRILWKQLK